MLGSDAEEKQIAGDENDILPLGVAGRILLRNWLLLLVGLLVGVASGVLLTRSVPPTYSATATQLVKGIPGTGVAANYEAAQFAVSRARSYPSFIYSQEVLDGVARDMGADDIAEIRESISATNPTDTPLVQITATGGTASQARDKANSAARHMATFITTIEAVDGKTPITVETAVQALLPKEPSNPRLSVYAAIGGSIGLVLAMVIAIVRFFAAKRLRGTGGPSRLKRRFGRQRVARPPAHALPDIEETAVAQVSGVWEAVRVMDPAPAGPTPPDNSSRLASTGASRRHGRRRNQWASRRVRNRV